MGDLNTTKLTSPGCGAKSETRTQAEDEAFDDFDDEAVEGDAFEFAVGGEGDEALHGGEDDEGESPGIAGDDFAGGLAFRESSSGVAERFFAGLEQFTRRAGAVFGLEHQPEQSRVLQGEADKGAGKLGQTRLEIESALLGGAAQGQVEPLKAAQGERVQQRLLVGKVAAR